MVLESPPLFGFDRSDSEPNFSPDEETMYFNSQRPLANETKEDTRIWFVKKTNGKWATTKVINESIGMFATKSNNGTVYFNKI